jgi:predicted chitinase
VNAATPLLPMGHGTGLDEIADADDFTIVTQRINGD